MIHQKLTLSFGLAFSLFGLAAVACSETADPAASSSSGDAASSGGSSDEATSSGGGSSGTGSSSGRNGSSGGSSSGSSIPDFPVVVNEVATSDDFVELFNPSDEAVDLSGFALTDLDEDTNGPKTGDTRLVLAAGTILEAGGYLTIVAGADAPSTVPVDCFAEDPEGPDSCLAASFRLSNDEPDAVFLLDAEGAEVLRVDLPASPDPDAGVAALEDTESWGRAPNGTGDFEILTTRTPGRSND